MLEQIITPGTIEKSKLWPNPLKNLIDRVRVYGETKKKEKEQLLYEENVSPQVRAAFEELLDRFLKHLNDNNISSVFDLKDKFSDEVEIEGGLEKAPGKIATKLRLVIQSHNNSNYLKFDVYFVNEDLHNPNSDSKWIRLQLMSDEISTRGWDLYVVSEKYTLTSISKSKSGWKGFARELIDFLQNKSIDMMRGSNNKSAPYDQLRLPS